MAEETQGKLGDGAAVSDQNRLRVPMLMQTLVFSGPTPTTAFVDLTPNYRSLFNLNMAPLGVRLKPVTNARQSPTFPAKGVHLHWTLPAAFAHVRHSVKADDPRTESRTRVAPNRWLVTRLWRGEDLKASLLHRSWIVQSDFRNQANAIPYLDGDRLGYRLTRMGRTVPLERWTKPDRVTPSSVRAFAPGNLAFAAFYPSCRGVFGFHDDLADLGDTDRVLSYMVAGWYPRDADDPLAGTKTPETWLERMAELQWVVPAGSVDLPARIICYAAVTDVQWGSSARVSNRDTPNVRVAMGSGLTEAIAALSIPAVPPADTVARFRNELEYATLRARHPRLSDLGDNTQLFNDMRRFAQLRIRQHERAFIAQGGGTAWDVVQQDDEGPATGSDARPMVSLTDEVADRLRTVNALQREQDTAVRELAAARRKLFLAWHIRRYRTTDGSMTLAARQAEDARFKGPEDAARGAVEALLRTVGTGRERLNGEIEALGQALPKACKLVTRAMPRFRRAGDPFILTAGAPMPEVQGGRPVLMCRTGDPGQAVQSFQSDALKDSFQAGNTLTRDQLGDATEADATEAEAWARAEVPADVKELMLDMLFADGRASLVLARRHLRERDSDPGDSEIRALAARIESAQQSVRGRPDGIATGWLADGGQKAPDPALVPMRFGGADPVSAMLSFLSAIRPAEPSACPVFMLWRAEWRAGPKGDPKSDGPSAAWKPIGTDALDYEWNDKTGMAGGGPARTAYEGFAIVARNLERGLSRTRERFEGRYGFAYENLTRLAGQSLSGLTDMMALLDTGAQLPPLKATDYSQQQPKTPEGLEADTTVQDLVGDEYAVAPLVGPSYDNLQPSPIRGGHLRITRLWLVDTFGRVRRVVETIDDENPHDPDIRLAGALRTGERNLACLAPRLVQPSRLLFSWMSATDPAQESLGDAGTSPICGWIVHNRLDQSLTAYAADGRVLGAIQPKRGESGTEMPVWSKLPPEPGARAQIESDVENPYLRGFLLGFVQTAAGAGHMLQDFRNLLDRIEDISVPSGDVGLHTILTGRPLALVRARLRLELDGPPMGDGGWTAMRFPVRLGDRRLGPDGLVGYFVDGESTAQYTKMRLSAEEKPGNRSNDYFDHEQFVEAACARSQKDGTMLTLLMDPRFGVHVVSGILPADAPFLPQPLVAAGMGGLEVPFLVAPVIAEWQGGTGAPTMPLPTTGHGDWSWTSLAPPASGAADGPPPDATAAGLRQVPVSSGQGVGGGLFGPRALYEGWLRYSPAKGGEK